MVRQAGDCLHDTMHATKLSYNVKLHKTATNDSESVQRMTQ